VVYISTKEDLARSTIVVTYGVRDLMGYSTVHSLNGESIVVLGDMERLIYVIQSMIDPESWREAGGNVGGISSYGEMIIVVQTRAAHAQIWELLNAMRDNWRQARP
jgi:hypothetical protein